MKAHIKKGLSLILALCMVLSLCSVSVWATSKEDAAPNWCNLYCGDFMNKADVKVGESIQLIAKTDIDSSDESLENSNSLVQSWTSSNEAIATVDESGRVTGVAAGMTTVYAHFSNNKSGSANVYVYNASKIENASLGTLTIDDLADGELKLEPGQTRDLTTHLALTYMGETYTTDAPDWFTSDMLSYSFGLWNDSEYAYNIADGSVAKFELLSQNGLTATFRVTAKSAGSGSAAFTAQPSGKEQTSSASFTLIVADAVHATSCNVSPYDNSVVIGETLQLNASPVPEDATDTVEWYSSNETIATVDGNGLVTAVGIGTAQIHARYNNTADGYALVAVTYPNVTGVTVLPSEKQLVEAGKTRQLSTELRPSGIVDTLTWSSADTNVATVDNNGLVTGIAEGTTTISATARNGREGSVTVQVTPAVTAEAGKFFLIVETNQQYATLQEALVAAEKFQTIKRINTEFGAIDSVEVTKSVYLDLNGRSIFLKDGASIIVKNNAWLTIKNTGPSGANGIQTSSATAPAILVDGGNLVVDFFVDDEGYSIDNYNSSSGGDAILVKNRGNVSVKQGNVHSERGNAIHVESGSAAISGGLVFRGANNSDGYAVNVASGSLLRVSGGVVRGQNNPAIHADSGATVEISGGQIRNTNKSPFVWHDGDGTFTITGGQFSSDPSVVCGTAAVVTKDTSQNEIWNVLNAKDKTVYEVVEGTVKIYDRAPGSGGSLVASFTSLPDAIAAVQNGQYIQMLQGYVVADTIYTDGKSFTLDLNNFSIEYTGNDYAISVNGGSGVTIKGGGVVSDNASAILISGDSHATINANITAYNGYGISVSGGSVTFDGGKLSSYYDGLDVASGSTAKVNGGTITSQGGNGANIKGELTVNSGSIISTYFGVDADTNSRYGLPGLYVASGASATLNGGSYDASGSNSVYVDGTATVTGGHFASWYSAFYVSGSGYAEIKGGYFDYEWSLWATEANRIIVTGGYFIQDPSTTNGSGGYNQYAVVPLGYQAASVMGGYKLDGVTYYYQVQKDFSLTVVENASNPAEADIKLSDSVMGTLTVTSTDTDNVPPADVSAVKLAKNLMQDGKFQSGNELIADLSIKRTAQDGATSDRVAYDVKPIVTVNGEEIELDNSEIKENASFTFTVTVPQANTDYKVKHIWDAYTDINGTQHDAGEEYLGIYTSDASSQITVTLSHFSELELVTMSQADAVASVVENGTETMFLTLQAAVNYYLEQNNSDAFILVWKNDTATLSAGQSVRVAYKDGSVNATFTGAGEPTYGVSATFDGSTYGTYIYTNETAPDPGTLTEENYTITAGGGTIAQGASSVAVPVSITPGTGKAFRGAAIYLDYDSTVFSYTGITSTIGAAGYVNAAAVTVDGVNKIKITLPTGSSYTAETEIASLTFGYTAPAAAVASYSFSADLDNSVITTAADSAKAATKAGGVFYPVYAISYTLDGGTVAAEANPAEYSAGSGAITLINPTKTGYDFAGWTGTGLTEPTTAVTIPAGSYGTRAYTATWTPAEVNYTVKHLQQSLEDASVYTEVTADAETKQGYTEAQTDAAAKTYEGFTAQSITQQTILADGSTVVEIRYDRNTFTVTFTGLKGDETEKTFTVPYGSKVTDVDGGSAFAEPTNANYDFVQWTYGANSTATHTAAVGAAVTENVSYTAQWTPKTYSLSLDRSSPNASLSAGTIAYAASGSAAVIISGLDQTYGYEVTAVTKGGAALETAAYSFAMDSADQTRGTLTINDATTIDGPIVVSLRSKGINSGSISVRVSTYVDAGNAAAEPIYLVLVKNTSAASTARYALDGNPMYIDLKYAGQFTDSFTENNVYAYLVNATTLRALAGLEANATISNEVLTGLSGSETLKSKITIVRAAAGTIYLTSNNVSRDAANRVDITDLVDVYQGQLNVLGALDTWMGVYLQADVNSDGELTVPDIQPVYIAVR